MIAHCPRGTKAFLGSQAHSYVYEAGGAAALGGIVMTPIRNTVDGELDLNALRMEIERPSEAHFAEPAMVALENTHNLCAGAAVELSHMAAVSALAHSHSLPVHLDGARIFNAAIALATTPENIASFDAFLFYTQGDLFDPNAKDGSKPMSKEGKQAFLDAIKDAGLRVGEDISVVGFDDTPMASKVYPALTTVRQPMAEMGRTAIELLVTLLQGQKPFSLQRELATELIVRESTRHPGKRR